MITAETITAEQIRGIIEHPAYLAAKAADRPPWRTQLYCVRRALAGDTYHRGLCAEIINERTLGEASRR